MRIAVIGTGNIGGSLGGRWQAAGHEVVFGSRNPAATGPAFVGDADASTTVDSLLPLWFALVRQHGGNRRLALRVVR